ncbi:MAG: hypothetical protein ACRD12_19895 [Acidimicrobiales bacterium]
MAIERLSTASKDDTTRQAKDLMQESLIACIEGEPPAWIRDASDPPVVAEPWLEDLLSKGDTYRAGALTIFCYAVASGEVMDMRPFSEGVRGTGEFTKHLLPHLSIPATRGNPFETIAKGAPSYVGRARQSWNDLLTWTSTEATFEDVQAVAAQFVRRLAALRRAVPPMPQLDTERLTWTAVVAVLDALLAEGSGGAYEQLIVASLIEALHADEVEQRQVYVTTKPVSASDESSRAAGDVQVREPSGAVREAVEVADTDWSGKVGQAVASMKRDDLRRFLVLARAAGLPSRAEIEAAIAAAQVLPEQHDIAVLDLRSEVRSMAARLDRVARRRMLQTLYRYLLDYQPRDDRVVRYVGALNDGGVVLAAQ